MSNCSELTEIVIDNRDKVVRNPVLSSGSSRGSMCFWLRYLQPTRILDPKDIFVQRWNKIILISCVLVLIGFVSPSSRAFGGIVLVRDHAAIAKRYLSSYFIIDLLAILPLPQLAVYVIIPNLAGDSLTSEGLLKLVIFIQYVPRVIRIYPLYKYIQRASGMITDTIWAGAALYLFLYMLASHVVGASWYLFAIDRQGRCWRESCMGHTCYPMFSFCKDESRENYAFNTSYCSLMDPNQIKGSTSFNYGLFYDALRLEVVQSTHTLPTLSYCFWWGLRSLSSCGQNLNTSIFSGENLFAALICVTGLSLFALLLGNMQKYLQMMLSIGGLEEDRREKRQYVERWMSRRVLPLDLKERIRRHQEYIWQETRGVCEQSVIDSLPRDLRMDIMRHLGLNLVMRVPMFENMDEQLKDVMCDRLKPMLYTENSLIVREGDPVNEMLFIMKGRLCYTTTVVKGKSDICNSCSLKEGDFCGEELLIWALDPRSSSNLPISTRTLQTETEVEAFALMPDDLKFVASQFRRLHSKQLRHTFRFYSPPWRTWAARFIQAAWRRYSRRKYVKSLREAEDYALAKEGGNSLSLGVTVYASRFAANAFRNLRRNIPQRHMIASVSHASLLILQKPTAPDFSSCDDG